MSILSAVGHFFGGDLFKDIKGAVDEFIHTDEEKARFQLALKNLLAKRESEVEQTLRTQLQAKERVIVAEMAQGDNYTKRARPTLIYFGLGVIGFNYCLVPMVQTFLEIAVEAFVLPTEFWLAWGGAVSVYSLGRSQEKRGLNNGFTKMAVGSKPFSLTD